MNMTCADAVLRETRIFSANNYSELCNLNCLQKQVSPVFDLYVIGNLQILCPRLEIILMNVSLCFAVFGLLADAGLCLDCVHSRYFYWASQQISTRNLRMMGTAIRNTIFSTGAKSTKSGHSPVNTAANTPHTSVAR